MKRNRIKQLVRRSLRERQRGAAHYSKSAEALQQAISAGLMEGQSIPVEIVDERTGRAQTVEFELVNNFAGEKAFRNATIPKFELKKVPKNPRSPQPLNPVKVRGPHGALRSSTSQPAEIA